MLRRLIFGTSLAAVPACTWAAYQQRCLPSSDILKSEDAPAEQSYRSLSGIEKHLAQVARTIVIGTISTATACILRMGNEIEIIDKHKLHRYTALDRSGQPLLTVSNHTSVLDDPGTIALLSPPSVRWRASRMRWSVCSEEYCFQNPAMSTFFSIGKGLPIQRGASIYQLGLAELAKKLDDGDWVHVFPEGRIWQENGTPYRDQHMRWCSPSGRCSVSRMKLGPLKWGTAKLIANADITPVVVPWFHAGMDKVVPQTHENQVRKGSGISDNSGVPGSILGKNRITIKIGDPVECVDLIRDYHLKAMERAKRRQKARGAIGESSAGVVTGLQTDDLPIAHSKGPDVREWMLRPSLSAKDGSPRYLFPRRTTTDGRVVPAYSEPVLRAKPPDHELLSPTEAAEEEEHRLALYEAISQRLWEALAKLEREVRDVRRHQGLAEIDDSQG